MSSLERLSDWPHTIYQTLFWIRLQLNRKQNFRNCYRSRLLKQMQLLRWCASPKIVLLARAVAPSATQQFESPIDDNFAQNFDITLKTLKKSPVLIRMLHWDTLT